MYGNIILGGYIYGNTRSNLSSKYTLSPIISNLIVNPAVVINKYPDPPRNTELDVEIEIEPFIIPISPVVTFRDAYHSIYANLIIDPTVVIYSKEAELIINAPLIIKPLVEYYVEYPRKNILKWSNIGSLNFDVGLDNVAGELPVSWDGFIYSIKKIKNMNIVYGANGISALISKENYFGEKQISKIGIKSKHAVVDVKDTHFFILNNNVMYQLTSELKIKKLDYSEYFLPMNNIVMTYDEKEELIYICDGQKGYIYSIEEDSLTNGPLHITGIGYKDGQQYLASSEEFIPRHPEFYTDIYDFGVRNEKYIFYIEVETNYTGLLYGAIDYRIINSEEFRSTPWIIMSKTGKVHVPCYGYDFRFKIKSDTTTDTFKIDSIKINGRIHDFRGLE
jgi:hypothetical protein